MDYDAKMAAMRSMMDYADEMEDSKFKPKKEEGIGSEEYNKGFEDEEKEEKSGGGGMDIMGLVSKFVGS